MSRTCFRVISDKHLPIHSYTFILHSYPRVWMEERGGFLSIFVVGHLRGNGTGVQGIARNKLILMCGALCYYVWCIVLLGPIITPSNITYHITYMIYCQVVLLLQSQMCYYIDGITQDCRNSIANALELLQSCAYISWSMNSVVLCFSSYHIDGLVHERHNSIANALELHNLFCTCPSISIFQYPSVLVR